ncbi:putative nuclear envelope pore membrane protein [Sciurus carolinensis]|uniref:Nuclear envelope pore membrane protein n=1 Tax=Sciurus carolinensis TaxID=30640 RepID=A0AA41MYD8_SCICA|nr:putative nuclear envelope pore membrane protein [Sciurus carolinensis]
MSPAAAAAGEGQRWRSPIESTQDCRDPARACSRPEGMALRVLALLGLVLYLAPARPLVAWLAVGATTAWWGLNREPDARAPCSCWLAAVRGGNGHCSSRLRPSRQ